MLLLTCRIPLVHTTGYLKNEKNEKEIGLVSFHNSSAIGRIPYKYLIEIAILRVPFRVLVPLPRVWRDKMSGSKLSEVISIFGVAVLTATFHLAEAVSNN